MANETKTYGIETGTVISATDGKPYVQFRFDDEHKFQLNPKEAMEFSSTVMQVAFAAEADAFIVDFIESKIGVEKLKAIMVLQDLRKWRENYGH